MSKQLSLVGPRWIALVTVALSANLSSTARADWPVARHDAQRTGATDGTSNITKPAVYWRTYLGGTIAPTGMLVLDVDGDGTNEVVFVTGGTVVAKRPDDSVVWRTPPVGIAGLIGASDLDGDNTIELVATSGDHVYVIALASGAFSWVEPDGEMGALGGVRMGDLSGDGLPDLLIEESACGGVNSGNPGFVYGFANGFASPTLHWTLPSRPHCGSRATTLADVDGNGALEVILGSSTGYSMLVGATGGAYASTPALGTYMDRASCLPIDIDQTPGDELFCVMNLNPAPGQGGRKVFVLRYTGAAFDVLWQQPLGDQDGGDLAVDPAGVVDLDSDGALEVLASGMSAAGVWTTHVLDAMTGATLATLPAHRTVGGAAIGASGEQVLLTIADTTLHGSRFMRTGAPAVTPLWTLPDRAVAFQPDWDRVRVTTFASRQLLFDQDADGVLDLLTYKASAGSALACHSVGSGNPVLRGTYTFPPNTDPMATWITPPINRTFDQIVFGSNDGWLSILDRDLKTTLGETPGMRIGGYYSGSGGSLSRAPVAGSLDGNAAQAIVVPDSRQALMRFNAAEASNTVPPLPVWAKPHVRTGTIVPGLDSGEPGIACWGVQEPITSPPSYYVAAIHAGGSSIWEEPVPRTPVHDVVGAEMSLSAVPDLVFQTFDQDTYSHTRALYGATGALLWNAPPVLISWGLQPLAAAPWNGDGFWDVFSVENELRVYSGYNGSILGSNSTFFAYFLPTIYDVDGDGQPEVTLHGGYYPARTFDTDLNTPIWVGTDDDRPYPYGAIAACPLAPVLIEGSSQHPSRLKITQLSGAGAGTYQTFVLASGQKFPTEADAEAAGVLQGRLGNVTVSASLDGDSQPTALLGSTDGWLYALHPCDGQMLFAHAFEAEVGEPVLADTDGDGNDEILVSVADGFLYGLRQETLPAPAWVWDTDPDTGATNADVSYVFTQDKLSAKWAGVPGAVTYEMVVVDAEHQILTSPDWVDVGAATEASITGLPLVNGASYTVGIRAVSAAGRSPDTASNGVTVFLEAADAGVDAADGAAPDAAPETGTDASPEAGPDSASGGTGGAPSADAGGDAAGGSAGGSGAASSSSDDAGGCGCKVVRAPSGAVGFLWGSVLIALGLVRLRRRR